MPSLTSLKARRALSAAMTISQTEIKPAPPPIAVPLTRATTGQGKLLIVSKRSASRKASVKFCSWVKVVDSFIILRSAPALKDGPAPVNTTAWSFSSGARSVKAICRSWISCPLKALCTSGRCIVMVAILSWKLRSTVMCVYAIVRTSSIFLHPEHPKWSIRHGCIKRCCNTQGQHCARITWVNNAIVPETGSAIVGITFILVLIENGLFESDLFLLAHIFASCLQPFFAYRYQYAGSLFSTHHRDTGIGPHPQLSRRIGAPAHSVVACSE